METSACRKTWSLVLVAASLMPLTSGAPRPGVVYLAPPPAAVPLRYHVPLHHVVQTHQLIITQHRPVYVYYPPEKVAPTTETPASLRRVDSPTEQGGLRQAPPTPTAPPAGPIRLFVLFSRFPWPLESVLQRVQNYFSTYNTPQVEPLLVEEIDLAPEPGHVDQDQLDPEKPSRPAEPEVEEEPIKPADAGGPGAVVADPLDPEEEEPAVAADLKPEIADVEPERQEVKPETTPDVIFSSAMNLLNNANPIRDPLTTEANVVEHRS